MCFLLILVAFGVFNVLYSEELTENSRQVFPVAIIPTEEIQPDAHDEPAKSGLSSKNLTEIYDLAKNISHSKGIYKEDGDGKVLRRSIVKKATVSSNSDIIKELLLTFESAENKLLLLEHMEDLVHDYDVAVIFATLGGMQIISPLLFSNDDEIVSAVALVLGSAMQSNSEVKKIAKDQNVGRKLFHLLTHKSPYVVNRIVFATSSFLRNSPEAQEEFLSANGVSRLTDILKDPLFTTNTKLKVIDLFSDLAAEQKTARLDQTGRSKEQIAALRRSFATETYRHHICAYIAALLDLEDYDSHQRLIDAMLSLYSVCHKYFRVDLVKDRFKTLLKIYYPGQHGKDPVYPYIDEELRAPLYSALVALYEKLYDGDNVSSYKYFIKNEL